MQKQKQIDILHSDVAVSNLCNVVYAGAKGEQAYRDTTDIWKAHGHKVAYLNPWDPASTQRVEPVYGADANEVKSIVLAHLGKITDQNSALKIYRDMEERILTSLIFAAQKWSACSGPSEGIKCRYASREESMREDSLLEFSKRCVCRRHLCTLPALAALMAKGTDAVKKEIDRYPEIGENISSIWGMGKRDIEMFFRGIQSKFALYFEPEMAHAFSHADFHLKEIIPSEFTALNQNGMILYVGLNRNHAAASTLTASIVSQLLLNQIFQRRNWMLSHGYEMNGADQNISVKTKTGTSIRPVRIKLDEIFSYLMNDFDQIEPIAASAGCNIETAF